MTGFLVYLSWQDHGRWSNLLLDRKKDAFPFENNGSDCGVIHPGNLWDYIETECNLGGTVYSDCGNLDGGVIHQSHSGTWPNAIGRSAKLRPRIMALYGFIMTGYIARWEAISSEDAFPSENNGSRDLVRGSWYVISEYCKDERTQGLARSKTIFSWNPIRKLVCFPAVRHDYRIRNNTTYLKFVLLLVDIRFVKNKLRFALFLIL
jgi:hypothetical protein